jgi:hypothetical protein
MTARLSGVREKAPPGFTTIAVPPFVVAGDGPPEGVRRDADEVVRWASSRLKADFFPLDPGQIIEVWLFSSEAAYMSQASVLFGSIPSTPYGYYSPCDHALIMNVSTGYGTLVHEMVHPLMEANFPGAPTWFDEGLASLFEEPRDVEGHLHGATNWRLAGLRTAITEHRAKPLSAIVATSRRAFYGDDLGLNYAEARYLLYYLQESGLLLPFYRRFQAGRDGDATGRASLEAIVGETLGVLDPKWQGFVLGLTYERLKAP